MRPGYIIIDEVTHIPDHVWDAAARRTKGANMDDESTTPPEGAPVEPTTPEPGLQDDNSQQSQGEVVPPEPVEPGGATGTPADAAGAAEEEATPDESGSEPDDEDED